ncbi:hypothetical protein [Mycoplasma yeatsii]|nr:hypothetical protein [Mycoplasma yeatsii]
MDNECLCSIEEIIKEYDLEIRIKSELTNVIAAHTGKETIALVAWKK